MHDLEGALSVIVKTDGWFAAVTMMVVAVPVSVVRC